MQQPCSRARAIVPSIEGQPVLRGEYSHWFNNLRWGDAPHTFITLTLIVEPYGTVAFHAMPTDPEPAGHELYTRCVAGEFGGIAPYQPNAASILAERDPRLRRAQAATVGCADAFVAGLLDDTEIARFKAWAAYQRDLVRLDQQPGFPDQIIWPTPPTDPEPHTD